MDWINKTWSDKTWINKTWRDKTGINKTWSDNTWINKAWSDKTLKISDGHHTTPALSRTGSYVAFTASL